MKNSTINIVLYTVIFSLFMPASVYALNLVPMSANLASSGRGSTAVFVVDNSGGKPIAVEMQIFGRSMTEEGKDILIEVDDDFVIYPSQMVIMPGESQSVRLRWIGLNDIVHEQAYRFVAEQLPIDLDEEVIDGASLKVLFRYVASVYVLPKRRLEADVKITDAYIEEGEVNQLIFIAKNEGTKHSILRNARLTLKSSASNTLRDGSTFELNSEQLPGLTSANILAGHSRKFTLPAPAGSQAGALDVELHY